MVSDFGMYVRYNFKIHIDILGDFFDKPLCSLANKKKKQ